MTTWRDGSTGDRTVRTFEDSIYQEFDPRVSALESHATPNALPDGAAATPAVAFQSDPDTGVFLLGPNRLAIVVGGLVAMYIQSDGTLVVPDAAAGDSLNLTSGTAPGSVVLGQNRALRAVNPARTGTTRLITLGNSDQIVIGSGGSEGGPETLIVLRTSAGNPQTEMTGKVIFYQSVSVQTAKVTIDPTGTPLQFDNAGAGSTVMTTKRAGDTLARMALLESGRAEYSSGSGSVDVIVVPRNAAGEWRLAQGYMLLDDVTTGAYIKFAARSATGVPNHALFEDSADGVVKYRDGSGTLHALW